MKELILLRGLPGAGKSTLAKTFNGLHLEADMFFITESGEYVFNPSNLPLAHQWCNHEVEIAMSAVQPMIIVSNTFTQEWEMESYMNLADKYGYRVFSLIVENRHGNVNVHNCPEDKVEVMKNRFQIKL